MLTTESLDYLKKTPLERRKSLGQYMTPQDIGKDLASTLKVFSGASVLDPAVGTGELLLAMQQTHPNVTLNYHGWDVDEEILKVTPTVMPTATLRQQSFFDPVPSQYEGFFDVIIGNPPYFELKPGDYGYDPSQFTVVAGRANIYALAFEYAARLLKDGGQLAFVVPPSMNAGAYFKKLRQFILNNFEIERVHVIRENKKFAEALTSVQLIVLKKTSTPNHTNNPHIVDFPTLTGVPTTPTVFTEDNTTFDQAWEGKKSLHGHGYEAVTGTVVWNAHKSNLRAVETLGSSLLYYAKDITSHNTIELSDKLSERRWFTADGKEPLVGANLLVNRIVGSLDSPRLKIAKVDSQVPYYAENHVNVIRAIKGRTQDVTLDELMEKLITIPNFGDYLKALTGNTQLSGQELTHLIPV